MRENGECRKCGFTCESARKIREKNESREEIQRDKKGCKKEREQEESREEMKRQ